MEILKTLNTKQEMVNYLISIGFEKNTYELNAGEDRLERYIRYYGHFKKRGFS